LVGFACVRTANQVRPPQPKPGEPGTDTEMNENPKGAHRLELIACAGAHNRLLAEISERSRLLGRDVASHPKTVRRVLADLDSKGPSEAGDVIHSLLFELALAQVRAARFADELPERE